MYLATTRYIATKKARQLNSWNQRLSNCSFEPSVEKLNPTKYLLLPGTFDQHQLTYKESAIAFSPLRSTQEPYLYSGYADKTISMPCMKRPNDSFGSPYSVSTACLAPFIDGRHWFAEAKDSQGIDKIKEQLNKKDKAAFDMNIETDSLENLRKRIKDENVKDPDVPLGWEKNK